MPLTQWQVGFPSLAHAPSCGPSRRKATTPRRGRTSWWACGMARETWEIHLMSLSYSYEPLCIYSFIFIHFFFYLFHLFPFYLFIYVYSNLYYLYSIINLWNRCMHVYTSRYGYYRYYICGEICLINMSNCLIYKGFIKCIVSSWSLWKSLEGYRRICYVLLSYLISCDSMTIIDRNRWIWLFDQISQHAARCTIQADAVGHLGGHPPDRGTWLFHQGSKWVDCSWRRKLDPYYIYLSM